MRLRALQRLVERERQAELGLQRQLAQAMHERQAIMQQLQQLNQQRDAELVSSTSSHWQQRQQMHAHIHLLAQRHAAGRDQQATSEQRCQQLQQEVMHHHHRRRSVELLIEREQRRLAAYRRRREQQACEQVALNNFISGGHI